MAMAFAEEDFFGTNFGGPFVFPHKTGDVGLATVRAIS